MKILLVLAAMLALAIFPIMYTARAVGAGRTGVWWIIASIILQSAFSQFLGKFVPSPFFSFVGAVVGGSFIYSMTLDTTLKKGFIIGLVSGIIVMVGILLLMALLVGSA